MKRRSNYGLLPLVLLVAWLGCKSSDPTTLGGAASIAAAPPAIPSTSSPATAATTPPASAANPALPGTAQSPINASAQNPASGPQQRNVELKEIMNELKSLGSLDPQAQAQLIQDLQQTDPAMWPLVVQAFRTSLAYRQRVKATAATSAGAVAAASSPADKTLLGASPAPASAKASAPAAALAAAVASSSPSANTATANNATAHNATANAASIDTSSNNTASTATAPPTASAANSKSAGDVQQVSHETTAEDDAQAAELLARTIATLEKEVQDAPQSSASAKAQLQLRMLYLAAGRRNDALRAMPGISGGEQDFWADEVFGLATYLDSDRTSDASRRATEATLHLRKAASRLAELGSLTVRNLAFCTEVSSFGTYAAFPQNEFKPGQHVLLYAEVENFKSEESPKGFHTALRSNYHIFDHQGRKVTDQELPLTEEHCQNRRRDYFIRYFLTIPARAYDGKYSLQLTIEDTLGRKIGQSSIDFTVQEK